MGPLLIVMNAIQEAMYSVWNNNCIIQSLLLIRDRMFIVGTLKEMLWINQTFISSNVYYLESKYLQIL